MYPTKQITQHPEALVYLLQNYNEIVCYADIAEKTRQRYLYDAEDFISFINENGFGDGVILKYKEYLKGLANISLSTKKGKLRIAKSLSEKLFYRGVTNENVSVEAKNFKVETGHKKEGLNQFEVDRIFNYLNNLPYEETITLTRNGKELRRKISTNKSRNILIASLLCFQGLRQFEVTGMLIEDISLANATALIKGKHRDDKEIIHLHPKTIAAIRDYLTRNGEKSGNLIKSRRGLQMSESSIRYIFTDNRDGIFKFCEIKDKTVHGMRHYFITTLLDKFKDPSTVMKFARLKSIETIKVYDDRLNLEKHLIDFRETF